MDIENRHIDLKGLDGTMLLRYIKETSSNEERSSIEAWLEADEGNERILLQTARIYYANNVQERIASRDPLAAYEKLERRLAKRVRRIWLKRFSTLAACVVVILGLSTLISYMRDSAGIGTPQYITLEANAGIRTHFDLPDGTVAYLNSGSSLSYPVPYDPKERKVSLSGEAYFKVAHNAEQPFVVSAFEDRYKVKVLGTEFNVQAYAGDDKVSTTLVEGSVNLEVRGESGNVSQRNLLPSEKAFCDLSKGEISVMKTNPMYETAWMDGKLIFKDTPLPEALKKLSQYYNVEFEIRDMEIKSYCLTGVLDNRLLSQSLDYLRISSNIDYQIEAIKTDDSRGTNRSRVILKKRK